MRSRVGDFFAFSSGGVTALGLGLRVLFGDSALVCVPPPGLRSGEASPFFTLFPTCVALWILLTRGHPILQQLDCAATSPQDN